MLHVTHDTHPLIIGNKVSIAQSVSLHGATLENNCMIGIGAKILDGSIIKPFSLVAAGTLIRENFVVPEGTLVAGVPGKVIRDLTDKELHRIAETPKNYLKYVVEYRSY
jgi:carbonic anhydrase/acetyltransferase-like protein (isoleucine patch superfamily)